MTQPFLYSVEREFPVSIHSLWRAWTDAAEIESWYHPVQFAAVNGATVSDLTVGGLWACGVDVQPHNFVAYFYGQYTKIVELELLEHTMHYTQSLEEFAVKDMGTPSHLVVINFEARGDKSWVKFSQFGELPDGQAEQARAGMESYLDSLGNFLASK